MSGRLCDIPMVVRFDWRPMPANVADMDLQELREECMRLRVELSLVVRNKEEAREQAWRAKVRRAQLRAATAEAAAAWQQAQF